MKIRTDFVTNSSSSSFCTIHAEGEKLGEIINKHKDFFNDKDLKEIEVTENGFIRKYGEWSNFEWTVPTSEDWIVPTIMGFLYDCFDGSFEQNNEVFEPLMKELEENKDEIKNTLTYFECSTEHWGWGEDEYGSYKESCKYDGKDFQYNDPDDIL